MLIRYPSFLLSALPLLCLFDGVSSLFRGKARGTPTATTPAPETHPGAHPGGFSALGKKKEAGKKGAGEKGSTGADPASSESTPEVARPAARRPGTEPSTTAAERDRGHRNEVLVVGRITAAPTVRELPSGDHLVTWRVGVARPWDPARPGHRIDSLTLISFDEEIIDRVRGWRVGAVIRVTGSLRRRIWRGPRGVRGFLEVAVATADPVLERQR